MCPTLGSARSEAALELVEQRALAAQDLPARGLEREPRRAIDLGELPDPARARRPFEREALARQRGRIERGAHRPRVYPFPRRLLHGRERDEPVRQREAGLLRELAPRGRDERLAFR